MTDKSQPQQVVSMLSLIRLRPECKIMPTRVDFTAPSMQEPTYLDLSQAKLPQLLHSTMIDAFTLQPSFFPLILQQICSTQKYYRENSKFQKYQFEEKIQRSMREVSNLASQVAEQNIPAKGPNSNYCQICQEKFEDYFDHIGLKVHQTRVGKSQVSMKIKELCEQFQASETFGRIKGTTKKINKDNRRDLRKKKQSKLISSLGTSQSVIQGSTNIQNHSTGLIQDTLV